MSYGNLVRQHRRISILRHLNGCSGYASNASILADVLNGVGVASSRDQVITELSWLRENGFIEYEDNADFLVVTATMSGVDIATGVTRHPDIKRPSPRA